MKRLLLLTLAAIPLFAAGVNFVYSDYEYYGDDYWYDEYWEDGYWRDGYWVYYPHGYYCVYYVWWYPWWWDFFWWRCHWCHHFSWDFFYCGFYIVWYDDGCWWFRPRYGRWVRYRLPYSYHEIWQRAQGHGISLPKKAPREINVPYKGTEIMELTKQKDPELFTRVQKEHKTGNLEKMRSSYMTEMKKEITRKNQEYRMENNDRKQLQSPEQNRRETYTPSKRTPANTGKQSQYDTKASSPQKGTQPRIIKKEKEKPNEVERKGGQPTQMEREGQRKQAPQDSYKKPPQYEGNKRPYERRDTRQMDSRLSKNKG